MTPRDISPDETDMTRAVRRARPHLARLPECRGSGLVIGSDPPHPAFVSILSLVSLSVIPIIARSLALHVRLRFRSMVGVVGGSP